MYKDDDTPSVKSSEVLLLEFAPRGIDLRIAPEI
jgi:hypothetical protein